MSFDGAPFFGTKDLHSVFSSKCRFFVACWLLRMTSGQGFSAASQARRYVRNQDTTHFSRFHSE